MVCPTAESHLCMFISVEYFECLSAWLCAIFVSDRLGGGSASGCGGGGLTGGNGSSGGGGGRDGQGAASHQTTATIAQELLKGGNSPTAEALQVQGQMSNVSQNAGGPAVRPKHQLFYLASVLNFTVQFSDFPRVSPS